MGHARVRQHPLDVRLGDGERGADEDRQRGDCRECRRPVLAQHRRVHRPDENPDDGGESRDLDSRRHETHRTAGSTLVHVRSPLVEGRRRHLEAEADHHQGDGGQHHTRIVEHVLQAEPTGLRIGKRRSYRH